MAIIDSRLWSRLRQGTMLQWLIGVNVAVFVLVHVMSFVSMATGIGWLNVLEWLEMPTSLPMWLARPWTLVTYMFTHYDVWHIVFNLLWFYWMGRIFMEFFLPKQLMGLYLLCTSPAHPCRKQKPCSQHLPKRNCLL